MFNLTPATRVFLAVEPTDMRQSFNGLQARVETVLGEDPLSGHLFVFVNRRANRLKLLFFDGSGLWVCAKRLERSRFSWPTGEGACKHLRPEQLTALLTGLEVSDKAGWYRR